MPADCVAQWPRHLSSGRLVEVLRTTDLTGRAHERPLVLLRTEPRRERRPAPSEARAGEKIVSIDGRERILRAGMLVIADGQRPVALAGVLGALAAIPVAGSLQVILVDWLRRRRGEEPAAAT